MKVFLSDPTNPFVSNLVFLNPLGYRNITLRTTGFTLFQPNVALHIETSHLICLQIKWLVSIWSATLDANGLIKTSHLLAPKVLASITGHYFMAAIKIGVKICFFQSLAPCSFKPILCPIDLSLVPPTLQSFLCSDHFTLEVDLIFDALLLVFKKQKSREKRCD